jgi:hypothetical protein
MAPPPTQDIARAGWQRRFWPTLVGIFFISSSYPVVMLFMLHGNVFEYARNDLAWSFHSVFLIPIAFGLLATAFNSKFFMGIDVWQRVIWISIFLVFIIPLSWAVLVDKQLVPTPDRVAASLQHQAIEIDQCLRIKGCQERYLNNDHTCLSYSEYSEIFNLDNFSQNQLNSKALSLTGGYLCALLKTVGNREIAPGPMATIILILKFILIMFVWLFVWFTLFLAFNWFNSIDRKTLYALMGCYIILLTWFPFQLYAEWHQWYGDFSHILLYHTFWVLFIIAALLLVLFTVWVIVVIEGANLVTTISAIQSIVVTAFAGLFYFKPAAIDTMFGVLERLPSPLFIVLMFVVLLYMTTYVRLLLIFSMGDNVSPTRRGRH